MFIAETNYQDIILSDTKQEIWLNPVGGMGDMLMASSVLKIINDKYPQKKFNVIRRSRFRNFFENHPAVKCIGHPPEDAIVVSTMFWKYIDNGKVEAGPGLNRPFQLLAQKFGLEIPVDEKFYYPNEIDDDKLFSFIPWKTKNIVIAPTSDSQKKNMNPMKWTRIVEALSASDENLILQVGVNRDPYIRGGFNLIDLTTPSELIALLRKCDLLITADNFVMHAAHLTQTPAIAIWGPTYDYEFGYPQHFHFRPEQECEHILPCMGRKGHKEINEYHKPCHLPKTEHCLNSINVDEIIKQAELVLNNKI